MQEDEIPSEEDARQFSREISALIKGKRIDQRVLALKLKEKEHIQKLLYKDNITDKKLRERLVIMQTTLIMGMEEIAANGMFNQWIHLGERCLYFEMPSVLLNTLDDRVQTKYFSSENITVSPAQSAVSKAEMKSTWIIEKIRALVMTKQWELAEEEIESLDSIRAQNSYLTSTEQEMVSKSFKLILKLCADWCRKKDDTKSNYCEAIEGMIIALKLYAWGIKHTAEHEEKDKQIDYWIDQATVPGKLSQIPRINQKEAEKYWNSLLSVYVNHILPLESQFHPKLESLLLPYCSFASQNNVTINDNALKSLERITSNQNVSMNVMVGIHNFAVAMVKAGQSEEFIHFFAKFGTAIIDNASDDNTESVIISLITAVVNYLPKLEKETLAKTALDCVTSMMKKFISRKMDAACFELCLHYCNVRKTMKQNSKTAAVKPPHPLIIVLKSSLPEDCWKEISSMELFMDLVVLRNEPTQDHVKIAELLSKPKSNEVSISPHSSSFDRAVLVQLFLQHKGVISLSKITVSDHAQNYLRSIQQVFYWCSPSHKEYSAPLLLECIKKAHEHFTERLIVGFTPEDILHSLLLAEACVTSCQLAHFHGDIETALTAISLLNMLSKSMDQSTLSLLSSAVHLQNRIAHLFQSSCARSATQFSEILRKANYTGLSREKGLDIVPANVEAISEAKLQIDRGKGDLALQKLNPDLFANGAPKTKTKDDFQAASSSMEVKTTLAEAELAKPHHDDKTCVQTIIRSHRLAESSLTEQSNSHDTTLRSILVLGLKWEHAGNLPMAEGAFAKGYQVSTQLNNKYWKLVFVTNRAFLRCRQYRYQLACEEFAKEGRAIIQSFSKHQDPLTKSPSVGFLDCKLSLVEALGVLHQEGFTKAAEILKCVIKKTSDLGASVMNSNNGTSGPASSYLSTVSSMVQQNPGGGDYLPVDRLKSLILFKYAEMVMQENNQKKLQSKEDKMKQEKAMKKALGYLDIAKKLAESDANLMCKILVLQANIMKEQNQKHSQVFKLIENAEKMIPLETPSRSYVYETISMVLHSLKCKSLSNSKITWVCDRNDSRRIAKYHMQSCGHSFGIETEILDQEMREPDSLCDLADKMERLNLSKKQRQALADNSNPNDEFEFVVNHSKWDIVAVSFIERGCGEPGILLSRTFANEKNTISVFIPSNSDNTRSDTLIGALEAILIKNKESTRNAPTADQVAAFPKFWEGRFALEEQMTSLLAAMQTSLGFMLGLLISDSADSEATSSFDSVIDQVFQSQSGSIIDREILKIMGLGWPYLKSEDKEQLKNQFLKNKISSELIDKFEQIASVYSNDFSESVSHRVPIIVMFGGRAHRLPWENIKCLRAHPVCRMASISHLKHQLSLLHSSSSYMQRGVNLSSVSGIINPTGDLQESEANMVPLFKQFGWNCIAGRTPSEQEYTNSIENNEIFVYCGHNSGGNFLSMQKVSKLRDKKEKGVVLLMGCSSGVLVDGGEFDSYGMVKSHLIRGSVAVIGNLWDVTSRDLDKVCLSLLLSANYQNYADARHSTERNPVFSSLISNKNLVSNELIAESRVVDNWASLAAKARDSCKLKNLNGAALVYYGLPVPLCRPFSQECSPSSVPSSSSSTSICSASSSNLPKVTRNTRSSKSSSNLATSSSGSRSSSSDEDDSTESTKIPQTSGRTRRALKKS